MDDKNRILFVCLGNICRSPAADAIFHKMVDNAGLTHSFEIDSAGTYGGHAGELPDARMMAAGVRRGIKMTHRSRQFRSDDFERFDHIIVMDDANYERVCRLAPDPESLERVSRMTDYCTAFDVDHVPDPYYGGHDGFDNVLDILTDACHGLLMKFIGEVPAGI